MTPISEIVKELGIKPHQLHSWEQRGWLGYAPVLKDADNNGQRIYTAEQVERIKAIHSSIEEQRKRGIKRTDLKKVEEMLLEKFGGEVTRRERQEIMVLPSNIEAVLELVKTQNKMILELQETVARLEQKKLPDPKDHTQELEDIKKQLGRAEEREERLINVIEQLQNTVETMQQKEIAASEPQQKKGFLSRFFT